MRFLYSLCLYLALPAVVAYFLWRGLREPAYRRGWAQRLEFCAPPAPGCLWIHAASVGEVAAALPLVRALRERYPRSAVLVTTFTPSGQARAAAALGDQAAVRFLPLDLPGATRRFLRRAAPRMLLLLETEIWPNLIHGCAARGIPVMLVNARLAPRSVERYTRAPWRWLFRPVFSRINVVAAASGEDAERFAAVGVPKGHIRTTGNLKFDLQLPRSLAVDGAALRGLWQARDRCVWVAASTHVGEEELVLDAFARLRRDYPDLLLVLAPRHPQRFAGVAAMLTARGVHYARRSRNQPVATATEVLLGDTLGELLLLFAAADLAFVGGSLTPGIGGHNLLEPAALRVPILVGPHLEAWAQVAGWLEEAGALRRVFDAGSLAEAIGRYLDDPAARLRAGAAAAAVVTAHGGALERTLALIPKIDGAFRSAHE